MQLLLPISAISLLVTVAIQQEIYRFLALCIFEMCVGLYSPSVAYLKGKLISSERRGKIYGLMRVPLNLFVLASLSTANEGMSL